MAPGGFAVRARTHSTITASLFPPDKVYHSVVGMGLRGIKGTRTL